MKTLPYTLLLGFIASAAAAEISLETAPPVVVRTIPTAGATDVDPNTAEIRVTYSKPMQDGSWSWSTWGQENFPETTGAPHYLPDSRTCVLPVKLLPGKFYATWLNSDRFKNFKDATGTPAVPYLLTFTTASQSAATEPASDSLPGPDDLPELNNDQRRVVAWTDRQFRSFFDARSFDGWSEKERTDLESRLVDTLSGPVTRDYYQAINTLAALHSSRALPRLRELAFERRDKNNRDRWMSVRALGLMVDTESVPDMIHLVYHGNVNTRWWAQISLVRLTGQNFGSDWQSWGKWWNEQGHSPRFNPEIIRWWDGQAEADQLAAQLKESDAKFLEKLP